MSANEILVLHIDTDRTKTLESAAAEIASTLEYEGFSNFIINEPVWIGYVTASNVRGLSKKARAKLIKDLDDAVFNICTEAGVVS
jgi:hypothetical protein